MIRFNGQVSHLNYDKPTTCLRDLVRLMKSSLIAPCGMNCGICRAHLRATRQCTGCRSRDKKCAIRRCETFRTNTFRFCVECMDFPCQKIKRLDKRYRTRYNMSMIENLQFLKQHGMREFLNRQTKRYTCPICEGIISVHDGRCYGSCTS